MKKLSNTLYLWTLIFVLLTSVDSFANAFTTHSTADTLPPVISNVSMFKIQSNMAIVRWDTNEIANSQVAYKVQGSTQEITRGEISYTLQHNVVMTNLIPETSYSVRVSSTDNSGNSSTSVINFTTTNIMINSAPTISGAPASSVFWDGAYSFTPYASDSDNVTLTFSIANAPAWASFNASNGKLSGVPGIANVGTFSNIIISVSDGESTTQLAPFSIIVKNTQTTTNANGTSTLTYAYPSSGSGSYNNIIHTTLTSSTSAVADGQQIESVFGSTTHAVKILDSGFLEVFTSIPEDDLVQQTKLISHVEGATVRMVETGGIELAINNNSNVDVQLKQDGGLLYCISATQVNQTCVEVYVPQSQATLNADGSISIVLAKEFNFFESTTTITVDSSGVISAQLSRTDQANNQTSKNPFTSNQKINAGAQIHLTGDGFVITDISNKRLDF